MRKLFLFLLILTSFGLTIDSKSFLGYSWPKLLVAKCLKTTSVFLVSTDKGEYIGSGVLISKSGRVLTAAHLFNHGSTATVKMVTYSGEEYDMALLAINRRSDLALLQPIASAKAFPFALVQKSDEIYVGEDLLVIGHPYAHFWTVTDGIVSRILWMESYACKMIETNATINPGNSGGPVFNTEGEVMGIVSAGWMTLFGSSMGIGIFVPVKQVHDFLTEYEMKNKSPNQRKRHNLAELEVSKNVQ